jgi:hypothetical protein
MKVSCYRSRSMTDAAAFTLRFRDPATHRLLRDVARAKGVSMSELAERLIADGLRGEAAELERTLESVLAHLRSYRPDSAAAEEAHRAAARAELEPSEGSREPLPRRLVGSTEAALGSDGPGGAAGRSTTRSTPGRSAAGRSARSGKAAARGSRKAADGGGDDGQIARVADMTKRLSAAQAADLPRRRPGKGG